jgi:mRNA interferase HigB
MQIIAKRTLKEFWARHNQAESLLRVWYALVHKAEWTGPADVKRDFGTNVDFIGDGRAIFDIGGNKYRLVVRISYAYRRVMIKFVGTHKDYDKIDPETV